MHVKQNIFVGISSLFDFAVYKDKAVLRLHKNISTSFFALSSFANAALTVIHFTVTVIVKFWIEAPAALECSCYQSAVERALHFRYAITFYSLRFKVARFVAVERWNGGWHHLAGIDSGQTTRAAAPLPVFSLRSPCGYH